MCTAAWRPNQEQHMQASSDQVRMTYIDACRRFDDRLTKALALGRVQQGKRTHPPGIFVLFIAGSDVLLLE
jgi:hypothetical protein